MSVNEYVDAFTEKMKLVHHLVPTELSNINEISNGLPTYFGLTMKLSNTLKEAIRVCQIY